MKSKLMLATLITLLISGCTQDELVKSESSNGRQFTASFEQNESRTYVEDGTLLRWTAEDQISLFEGNALNQQYQFAGKTGANGGYFNKVNNTFGTGNDLGCHYAIYPYASDIEITDSGVITATLPSEQSYAENSFGLGDNTMVAVTQNVDDTFLKFKNVGGYLKLQLYGDDVTVKTITLQGNSNEKIAGTATITATYGGNPTVSMADDATETITLDCGEGVKIGTTEETATAFWLVVPPTTFENGFTVTITNNDEGELIQSTSNELTIERNVIKPMEVVKLEEFISSKIIVNQAGTLSTLISTEEQTTMTELKLKGEINSDDILFIRNMSKLETLDLSQVNIVEGGSIYYSYSADAKNENGEWEHKTFEYTTSNNVFPSYFTRNAAFINTLSSVILPNSITKIGEYALEKCNKITTINIPDNVTEIGMFAFSQCNLNSIYIPQNLQTISAGAFMINPNLSTITIDNQNLYFTTDNGILYNKDKTTLLFCPMNKNTDITIPNGVTEIYDFAFSNCSCSSLTLPESLVTIGNSAFMGARGLTQIIIPDNVTKIKSRAFVGCANIKNIIWSNSIETIEESCFQYCSNLQSIENTENVKYVKSGAFENCSSLLTINLENVISIDDNAFYYCQSLSSITLSDVISTIGSYAFYYSNLTTITIPESIESIDGNTFSGCTKLEQIYLKSSTPPTMTNYISNGSLHENFIFYVPTSSVAAYKNAEKWSNYADHIVGFDFN